ALDNLLSGDFMGRVPRLPAAALALVLALGAGVAATLVTGAGRNVLVYAAFLCVPPAMGVAFFLAGLWLPVVVLEASVLVTLTGSGVANYATEGKQKRYIKNAFQQYLSPAVIEELIAHPERLKLGGERRVLSIFFSDLQGFTGISEGLSPEELTALLNDYLSAMTDIIQEEGGTVDKYEGDAIIAFWNAPLSQEDHAARAVRAALRCQKTLARLRPEFRQRMGRDLCMRIGINTGPAVVGNMGSHSRFDYTMLGDAVNLAARLEGINKQFGTYTMISRDTLSQAGDGFPARELSRVAVVGRAKPVTVYEPMLPEEYRQRGELLAAFAEGLQAYYAGDFERAARLFERIADTDPPAARYLERCRELMEHPPESWDGVWVMTAK
ncbi:MAG: adenylate/guanylate cyclase domain-containing protein, partial [Spirochaetota bacterium]